MKIVNPVGKKGEEIALHFLKKKGYTIVETNFRKNYGEVDIIAIDQGKGGKGKSEVNTLVFIEVKTRTSDQFGDPVESITPWKIKSLKKTGQLYKMYHPKFPDSLRIDAVLVKLLENGEVESIEHLQSITD